MLYTESMTTLLHENPLPPKVVAGGLPEALNHAVVARIEGHVPGGETAGVIAIKCLRPLNTLRPNHPRLATPRKAGPRSDHVPTEPSLLRRPLVGNGEEVEELIGVADAHPRLRADAHHVDAGSLHQSPGVVAVGGGRGGLFGKRLPEKDHRTGHEVVAVGGTDEVSGEKRKKKFRTRRFDLKLPQIILTKVGLQQSTAVQIGRVVVGHLLIVTDADVLEERRYTFPHTVYGDLFGEWWHKIFRK